MAWVAAEVQAQSAAQRSGLKDPALQQLWLRFNLWPRNFHLLQVCLKKKKKKLVIVMKSNHNQRTSKSCLSELLMENKALENIESIILIELI